MLFRSVGINCLVALEGEAWRNESIMSYFTRSGANDCCKCCGKTIAMLKDRVWTPEKERMYNGLGNWESDSSRSALAAPIADAMQRSHAEYCPEP